MGNRIKHPSQRLTKAFLDGQKSLETGDGCPYKVGDRNRVKWLAGRNYENRRLDPNFYEPPGKM